MIINMNGAKAPETPSPVLQEKTVTPQTLPTVIGADEGYTGLSQVTVNPDAQLIPTNIRSGKTIFGVGGTFEGVEKPFYTGDLRTVTLGGGSVSYLAITPSVDETITLETEMPYIIGDAGNFTDIYMTAKNDVGSSTYVQDYLKVGTNERTSTNAYHVVIESQMSTLFEIPVDTTGLSSSTALKVSYKGKLYAYVFKSGTGASSMKYGVILNLGIHEGSTTLNPQKGNNAEDVVRLFLRVPLSIDANIPVGYLAGTIDTTVLLLAEDMVIEVTR